MNPMLWLLTPQMGTLCFCCAGCEAVPRPFSVAVGNILVSAVVKNCTQFST
jgi:hypothetical protein